MNARQEAARKNGKRKKSSTNAVSIIVALIGVAGGWGSAYLSNFDKIQKGQQLADQARTWANLREGHYQWQWAKEGWMGDLSIKKDASGDLCATLDITKYCSHWGQPKGKVIVSRSCGTVAETSMGQPEVTIPVTYTAYDDKCEAMPPIHERLVMILNPREAYTGSIDYIDDVGKASTGSVGVINWDFQPQTGNRPVR